MSSHSGPRFSCKKAQKALSPVVHDIGGLICRVNGILVADLHSPRTLLGHVCTTYQLGPKTPAFTVSQFHIHGHIVIGLLQGQAQKSQGATLVAALGQPTSSVSQVKVPRPASGCRGDMPLKGSARQMWMKLSLQLPPPRKGDRGHLQSPLCNLRWPCGCQPRCLELLCISESGWPVKSKLPPVWDCSHTHHVSGCPATY